MSELITSAQSTPRAHDAWVPLPAGLAIVFALLQGQRSWTGALLHFTRAEISDD
jgi:hypothetical protein